MRLRLIGIAILLTLLSYAPLAAAKGKVILVSPDGPEQLKWIDDLGGSIEGQADQTNLFTVHIPDELETILFDLGVCYQILIDDVQAYAWEATEPVDEAMPKGKVDLDHFLNFTEMETFLFDLEKQYPDILSVTEAGQTTRGKPLYLVKVSDNVAENEPEPELFFEGQIHGDEIAGYMLSLHAIEHLVTQYGIDPVVTDLVDGREAFFLPATNSDGAFGLKRSRYNARGVDMNRDNGYMWHADGNSSGPFGEAETQVLFSIWADHAFVFQTSWHAGTVAVSLPWSYHRELPPDWDEHLFLGEGYCAVNDSIDEWFQGSTGMYQMHGSTKDGIYGAFGAHAWTVELTLIKQIGWPTMENVMETNLPSILWLMDQAGAGLTGTVTDAQSGEPVAAVIDIEGGQIAYNDPAIGDFHRFTLPGRYDVTIWANGYKPVYHPSVSVGDKAPTDLSVTLEPDPSFGTWATKWLYNFGANDQRSRSLTKHALGPPDGRFYSVGYSQNMLFKTLGAHVVLDLGPGGINDEPGDDLFVYEAGEDPDEAIKVYGATEPLPEQWTLLGTGLGDCSFDIGQAGLSFIRYVRIEDQHEPVRFWHVLRNDGYDLDAVGKPYSPPEDDDDDDDNDDDTADDDDGQNSVNDEPEDQNGCGC